jgi:hypothetical protein
MTATCPNGRSRGNHYPVNVAASPAKHLIVVNNVFNSSFGENTHVFLQDEKVRILGMSGAAGDPSQRWGLGHKVAIYVDANM